MRSNTTYTDIRGIMRRHEEGLSAQEISKAMFIAETSVQQVIDVRYPKAKVSKKKETVLEE